MSDERWIKVAAEQRDILAERGARSRVNRQVAEAFDAAEGQRVESISWCETHGAPIDASGCLIVGRGYERQRCVIVDATLILPPKDAA